jgi:hypothetical protein
MCILSHSSRQCKPGQLDIGFHPCCALKPPGSFKRAWFAPSLLLGPICPYFFEGFFFFFFKFCKESQLAAQGENHWCEEWESSETTLDPSGCPALVSRKSCHRLQLCPSQNELDGPFISVQQMTVPPHAS